jgi:cell division septation protein DedD
MKTLPFLAAAAALGACVIAVPAVTAAQGGAALPAQNPEVKAGIEAWLSGDHAGAIRRWKPLAERGDADAQFNIGQAYRYGRGVPLDLKAAQGWFEKAAAKGHGQATANLGLLLFQNGQRAQAMPWVKKAADAGDPRAQYVLGTALFNGDIIGKDWPRAYALMHLAAGQGLPPAATNLEQMDKLVPLADRQKGLQLAKQLDQKRPAPVVLAARASKAAPQITRTDLPPSKPAQAAPAPKPAAAKAAAAAARPAGGWRVQLGAFSSAANAQRQWGTLKGKVGSFASLQPNFVAAGSVTRLQAGPVPNRAAADKLCAAAKAAGSACFPVAP